MASVTLVNSCMTAGHVRSFDLHSEGPQILMTYDVSPIDLAGWQLDKIAANPKKQVGDSDSDSDGSDDEDVPFACLICRKPYTEPVVTRCGHYFCSACAIKRFAKTPKCAACGAPTGGIFNRAEKIMEKLNKKKKKKEDKDGEDSGEEGASHVRIEGLGEGSGGEDGGSGSEEEDE